MTEKVCENYTIGGWHLRKEVTVGQLITIFMIAVSGMWWASSVETRLTQMSMDSRRIEEKSEIVLKGMDMRFQTYQADIQQALQKIDRYFERIEQKIDQKADRNVR